MLHRNLTPAEQADQVREVKRYESGMVINPLTIHPETTLKEVRQIKAQRRISGFPVVERGSGKLVGILTNRDMRFETSDKATAASADDHARAWSRSARGSARPRRAGCCASTRSSG